LGACTGNRAIDLSSVATKTPEEAWADLIEADKGHDLDDLRDVSLFLSTIRPLNHVRPLKFIEKLFLRSTTWTWKKSFANTSSKHTSLHMYVFILLQEYFHPEQFF
jgi:hypothetical protein